MEPFISIPAGDVLFTFSHRSFTEVVPNLIEACQGLPLDAMRERALNQPDDLLTKMEETRKKWVEEEEDDTDRMLNDAIALSVENGKGWAPGEREAYLKTILDDDFIPPIFAGSQEELDRSGLAEAFSSLMYDDPPEQMMLELKKKGNDAFLNGKRNEAKNVQYYRDAVNLYYEAFGWAQRVEPMNEGDMAQADTEKVTYSEKELDDVKSTLYANAAMAHMLLKNWGHVRDDSEKALIYNKANVKAWYRLAKAHQMLQSWEAAGDAIDSGLANEPGNSDLKKLEQLLADKVRKARHLRQQRERKRAERVARVKEVWRWCKDSGIKLGRVPLVNSVTDDDGDDEDGNESYWHHHHPHSGRLPEAVNGEWSWPCMFLYPSHNQSDFVQHFAESEMLAMRMVEMFPELEHNDDETLMQWDFNNEFRCSNLTIYFEVHCTESEGEPVHPESVELLKDQASTMKFYEASRALKGDEGPDMANVARAVERKHLYTQRKAWKRKHGSLWAKPDHTAVVRVHPAMTLRDVLTDSRTVVPNVSTTPFVSRRLFHVDVILTRLSSSWSRSSCYLRTTLHMQHT
jgi:tetratricopeptide (TPR) repeat protein